jgi:hypothetical protein
VQEIGFAGAELSYYSARNSGALTLIDGHMLQEEVGDTEIPCLITDLTDEEADKLLLTYDALAGLAEADTTKLDSLLQELYLANVPRVDNHAGVIGPVQRREDFQEVTLGCSLHQAANVLGRFPSPLSV